jgi:hypothetical protein
MKKIVRLTESDINRLVKKVLFEQSDEASPTHKHPDWDKVKNYLLTKGFAPEYPGKGVYKMEDDKNFDSVTFTNNENKIIFWSDSGVYIVPNGGDYVAKQWSWDGTKPVIEDEEVEYVKGQNQVSASENPFSKFPCVSDRWGTNSSNYKETNGKEDPWVRGWFEAPFYFRPNGTFENKWTEEKGTWTCNGSKVNIFEKEKYIYGYKVKTNGGNLNIRKSPSSTAPVVGKLKNGEEVNFRKKGTGQYGEVYDIPDEGEYKLLGYASSQYMVPTDKVFSGILY